jgi:copper chaperone CopZ
VVELPPDAPTVRLQVNGLFMPQRVDAFRDALLRVPEVRLDAVDFDTATATLAYDPGGDLAGATSEQIIEHLDGRLRQASNHTLGCKPISSVPREQLERIDIPIVGLDCAACSFAVYEILARTDGVEQAQASFHDGRATAWIDPARVDRAKLLEAFTQRGVTLGNE